MFKVTLKYLISGFDLKSIQLRRLIGNWVDKQGLKFKILVTTITELKEYTKMQPLLFHVSTDFNN